MVINMEKHHNGPWREHQIEVQVVLGVVTSHIIYNIYFQSTMQIAEENMKENNTLPAHHPPSLNIHTVNDAEFLIQAQRGATC